MKGAEAGPYLRVPRWGVREAGTRPVLSSSLNILRIHVAGAVK